MAKKKRDDAEPVRETRRASTVSVRQPSASTDRNGRSQRVNRTQRTRVRVSELPGTDQAPTGPDESWQHIVTARLQAFDASVPVYILDKNYFFLDWNKAFDHLVAVPMGLRRVASHAGEFVAKLKNGHDVFERSKQVFAAGREPLIDTELLIYERQPYGEIEFQKVAVQVADSNGHISAWIVYLNISRTERPDKLWEEIRSQINEDLHWARYALSYDKLLLNFDDYGELVSSAVKWMKSSKRCLDLGCGTGNPTLKLLQQGRPDREVWAIEANHSMLQQLIDKVAQAENVPGEYFSRLKLFRENILRLQNLPRNYFDGAALINVLYTLDDPEFCLREVYEILQHGGTLVLSTPHRKTNVDRLFNRMREVLLKKGVFEQLRNNYEDARKRHEAMMDRIHRDTEEDIRRYIEGAGFHIESWQPAYVDAVVLVKATK